MTVLRRTEGVRDYTEDCSNKPFCGLSSETLQYACGTLGIGDPTGLFPKDCPF